MRVSYLGVFSFFLFSTLSAKNFVSLEKLYEQGDATTFRRATQTLRKQHLQTAQTCEKASQQASNLDEEFWHIQMAKYHRQAADLLQKTGPKLARRIEFHREPPAFTKLIPFTEQNKVFYEFIDSSFFR